MMMASLSGSVGDYAACLGTAAVDSPVVLRNGPPLLPDGAFEAVKGVRFIQITDGLSNTLRVGEKHVPPDGYGQWPLDCGLYDGLNPVCNTRSAGPLYPLAVAAQDSGWKFGSAHPGLCQFVFCDGSVHALTKTIDPAILGLLAQRNDGLPIPDY
jgi:prepilin-type processing-associated H-X9-DG protein